MPFRVHAVYIRLPAAPAKTQRRSPETAAAARIVVYVLLYAFVRVRVRAVYLSRQCAVFYTPVVSNNRVVFVYAEPHSLRQRSLPECVRERNVVHSCRSAETLAMCDD